MAKEEVKDSNSPDKENTKGNKKAKPTDVDYTKSSDKGSKKKPKKSYVHIDTFLNSAREEFGISKSQAKGFKVHMNGHHYQVGEKAFIKNLEEYLGKKLK